MKGILFGEKHSFDDWGLILTGKSIGLPEPKTSSVEIEGADGVIDTSEVLTGEIKFNNRTLAFEFVLQDKYEDFSDKVTEIANYLHGRKLKIILDEDSEYYYYGRCSINQWTTDKRLGTIVITCDCDPYKMDLKETVIVKNIDTEEVITIIGTRKTVCPVIELMTWGTDVKLNDKYDLVQGENQFLDLFIKEGYNYLKFTGSGKVKITYQGGVI